MRKIAYQTLKDAYVHQISAVISSSFRERANKRKMALKEKAKE